MADLRFGEFEIDTAAELLRRDGETVHLEPRIFHLLVYLLEHRDRLVTKQDLNEQVWAGAFVTDNAVDRAVARLRKALGDDVHAAALHRDGADARLSVRRQGGERGSAWIAARRADARPAIAPGTV